MGTQVSMRRKNEVKKYYKIVARIGNMDENTQHNGIQCKMYK